MSKKLKKTVRITVFRFDALEQWAQQRAIIDEVNFQVETAGEDDSQFHDIFLEMEEMQTPWFIGDKILFERKDMILEILRSDTEWFYLSGRRYDNMEV